MLPASRKCNTGFRRSFLSSAALVVLFGIFMVPSLLSQVSYYGSIRGIVRDTSGAAIPGAKVSLVNAHTNISRTTSTNSHGEYVFTNVIPATYSVMAEHSGFKKLVRSEVHIDIDSRVSLDLTLEIGALTQSVQVSGGVPLIQTATASQGQVLTSEELDNLPNIGRNALILAKIAPNVVPYGSPVMVRQEDQTNTGRMSVAGSIDMGLDFVIDGVPVSDWIGRPSLIPTPAMVSQVRVVTNDYDAQVGRSSGAMINVSFKSGTNQLHGMAYGAIRRNSLDANNFFGNAAGLPLPPNPNDDWAGNLGGPVYIPRIYDGRNRTFWFASLEGYNNGAAYSQRYFLPTAAERQGDFSQTVTRSGAPLILYDPLSTVQNPDGAYTRQSFLSETGANMIPSTMINPIAAKIMTYYPMPQTTPAYYGQADRTFAATAPSGGREEMVKLDEQFTNWWHSSISYAHGRTFEPSPDYFGGPASVQDQVYAREVDLTAINNLFMLSPTSVLAVRYGFVRFPLLAYTTSHQMGFNPATLGFPQSYVSQLQGLKFPAITGTTLLGGDTLSPEGDYYSNPYSKNLSVMFSKTQGRNTLKAGFDFRHMVLPNYNHQGMAGQYAFNGIFTQSSPTNPLPNTGADLADLLLGYPSSGSAVVSETLTDVTNYEAVYGQDDIRVTPRLTINLGLRWGRQPGFHEVQNRLYTNFDTSAVNPLAPLVTGVAPRGVIQWAGQFGAPTYVGSEKINKLGPRVGAAYMINNKTVIRGGFGIIYGPGSTLTNGSIPAGFSATTPYIASTNGNATPANSLSNPFPSGLLQPVGFAAGTMTGIGQNVSIVAPDLQPAKVEQYSVDLQRELPEGIVAEVGYVGSHGADLPWTINQNVLDPAYFSLGAGALDKAVANPFYGHSGLGIIGTPTVPYYQLLRPYITYGDIDYVNESLNSSEYDSLIVKVQKRMTRNLGFLSSFTWAKSYDSESSPTNLMPAASGLQNPYDLAAERSLSQFDAPLMWNLSFSYHLPVGDGQRFLSGGNRALDLLVGGWSIYGIGSYRSGFPTAIRQSTNFNAAFGYQGQRPNATGVSPQTSGSLESRLDDYLNPAAFSIAPEFTFGNAGRFLPVRGPGAANWDISAFKTVTLIEPLKAQFRANAYNVFNTPMFVGPNATFGSGSFGHITSQANFARQIELALRFMW